MNLIPAIIGLALLPLVASQSSTCTTDGDCNSGECCTSSLVGKRKRLVFDTLLGGGRHGSCRPLAAEGHVCEPDLSLFGSSQSHAFGCPCSAGLECHGEQESHHGGSHSFTNPKCVPAGSVSQQGSSGTGNSEVITESPDSMVTETTDSFLPVYELPGK